MNPKVNILIVTYNAEQYIEKTLRSCLNQTYDNFDVLILDNASRDATVKIIESFKDKRVKLYKSNKNIGPYAGLNKLLDKADGDYIAIQDHDDIWFPTKIEKQVKFLSTHKDYIACGTWVYIYYERYRFLVLTRFNEYPSYIRHTSLMFRRKPQFRYKSDILLSDEYFIKKTLGTSGRFFCVQEGLTIHRIRYDSNNLSKKRRRVSRFYMREYFFVNGRSFRSIFNVLMVSFKGSTFTTKILYGITKVDKIKILDNMFLKLKDFHKKFPDIEV